MDLKGLLKLIVVKGTAAENSLVRITNAHNGMELYKGEARKVGDVLLSHNWLVVEVTRMDTWDGVSTYETPIYNRPYRIVVT